MGTDNSSWGEDINPMATVETCDSSYQENMSLNYCNDSVKKPATSPLLQSVVPPSLSASQVARPRVDEMPAEVPLGESIDDEFLTVLASSDAMPQWYIPRTLCSNKRLSAISGICFCSSKRMIFPSLWFSFYDFCVSVCLLILVVAFCSFRLPVSKAQESCRPFSSSSELRF
jgi:hypothetical protein